MNTIEYVSNGFSDVYYCGAATGYGCEGEIYFNPSSLPKVSGTHICYRCFYKHMKNGLIGVNDSANGWCWTKEDSQQI